MKFSDTWICGALALMFWLLAFLFLYYMGLWAAYLIANFGSYFLGAAIYGHFHKGDE